MHPTPFVLHWLDSTLWNWQLTSLNKTKRLPCWRNLEPAAAQYIRLYLWNPSSLVDLSSIMSDNVDFVDRWWFLSHRSDSNQSIPFWFLLILKIEKQKKHLFDCFYNPKNDDGRHTTKCIQRTTLVDRCMTPTLVSRLFVTDHE